MVFPAPATVSGKQLAGELEASGYRNVSVVFVPAPRNEIEIVCDPANVAAVGAIVAAHVAAPVVKAPSALTLVDADGVVWELTTTKAGELETRKATAVARKDG